MVDEILEVFKKKYEKYGDKLILDQYIPKDGTYILVDYNTWEIIKKIEIKYDKKTKEIAAKLDKDFDFISACDYYSSLLDMNKPMDPKKVIHSNQLYAFFIKKNVIHEKLNDEILIGYKENIFYPKKKYKVKESLEIYENIEKELPSIDIELGEKIFKWLRENIYKLVEKGTKESNYLKIFFISNSEEDDIKKFKNEYKRYVIPNIYNSNSYNKKIENEVYGLSNNNMGLNAKKPYLENKTRKIKAPYLVSSDEILLQKSLYDYLLILAKLGKTFVYFNENEIEAREPADIPYSEAEYLLKISYSKEVEIKSFEIICAGYNRRNLTLEVKDIFTSGDISKKEIKYGNLGWNDILNSVKNLFFNGNLSITSTFYDEELDIKDSELKKLVFKYRAAFHRWLYYNDDTQLKEKIKTLLVDSILFSLKNNYLLKIKHQLNFWLGLEKYFNKESNVMEEMKMISKTFCEKVLSKENWNIESDEEYAYAVGQFLAFLNYMKNTKNKNADFIKEILAIKDNKVFQDRVTRFYKRNTHNIGTTNKRMSKTIANIMEYSIKDEIEKVTNYVIAGFSNSIVFFEKGE